MRYYVEFFLYKYFLRKILFLLNPETAHKVVESFLYLTPNKLFNIFLSTTLVKTPQQ